MGVEVRPGTRLRSAVCDTEIVVVKAPAEEVDLRCGNHPMLPLGDDPPEGLSADAPLDEGTQMGKRYTDESGEFEVLCTTSGASSLSLGGRPLVLKDAKPLPSSD